LDFVENHGSFDAGEEGGRIRACRGQHDGIVESDPAGWVDSFCEVLGERRLAGLPCALQENNGRIR
jgi:hypothetical protein